MVLPRFFVVVDLEFCCQHFPFPPYSLCVFRDGEVVIFHGFDTPHNEPTSAPDASPTPHDASLTHWTPLARVPLSSGVASVLFLDDSVLVCGCDNGALFVFDVRASPSQQ